MKTSKLKSIFAFLFIAAVAFTSCKKDDPKPAAEPIVGSWIGKYGAGNNVPSAHFSFSIEPNGSLAIRDVNKHVDGFGTWKLDGETFTGVYTYHLGGTYNMAAKYNQAEGTLTGSWGEGESGTGDGEFFLNKE